MKGIILCGGKGTRLQPITYYLPKQLIPIANKPLLFYTIELLLKSGIKDISIVADVENMPTFKKTLRQYFKRDFEYIVQKNPRGVAHGLLSAKEFINEEKFITILGDNSFQFDVKKFVDDFAIDGNNCRILLKEVKNPEKFGVAYVGNDRLIDLEEKPKIAFSNLAITGIYAFDRNIFKACKEIKPSLRGEYEITDAIRWMLNNGYDVGYEIIEGDWKDVGSPIDVIEENISRLDSLKNDLKGEVVSSNIVGDVVIEEGAIVYDSVIRGPIIVGENSIIKHSYIGPYTSIGNGVNINRSNVENSIILDGCIISEVEMPIDQSIIGESTIITNQKRLRKVNRFVIGKSSKIYLHSNN